MLGTKERAGAMEELIELCAKTAHEVNREYCLGLGDDSQPRWEDAPHWQRNSARNGARFHIQNPGSSDSRSHDEWLREKRAAGWVWGDTKDVDAKTHPCIVAFDNLPMAQQIKDGLFRRVVRGVAAANS